MNNNLESIMLDGENIDLNSNSIEELKDILNKINNKESTIKEDLDGILRKLYEE